MAALSIADAGWLASTELQSVLSALNTEGEEARIAGGAVRNALLGEPVSDVDIATTALPDDVIARASGAGFKTVPTGIEHGTVTVIAGGRAFEVTTLRSDIETNGRHAVVKFGRDWLADAERRDFTINGLYATADGTVIDLVGGLADIEARAVRFIGDPRVRIREDYLRILRFFRFFARYGSGRPDADGLRACVGERDGLTRLSAERVWKELRLLLGAPDPSRALLWMRQAAILQVVLPESEKWGIDNLHPLIRAERELGWPADPLLRLEAVVPPDAARMTGLADRLRLSNADRDRLTGWAATTVADENAGDASLAELLYRGNPGGMKDRLRHAIAMALGKDEPAENRARQLAFAESWTKPPFPLSGSDLIEIGRKPGPELGTELSALEERWIDSGFSLDRGELLVIAAETRPPA